VEEMLAARLRGDANAIQEQIKIIDRAYKAGLSYMRGKRVFSLIDKTCNYLSLEVLDAQANPSDGLGDVCITLKNGSKLWVEVKGQTKKERFRDITQADYVREGTDFAKKFARLNPAFDTLILENLRTEVALDDGAASIKNWELADLWVADLALLVSEKSANGQVLTRLRTFLNS
jgi:hypothetical protein